MNGLSADKIRQYTELKNVFVYESVGSTSDEAKAAFRDGLSGDAIFAADTQTAGRGRSGKSFYSPARTGLYFTVLLRISTDLHTATYATPAAAVAVSETLSDITGIEPAIKWVNDIFIGNKKVCGILTEALIGDSGAPEALAIGIGINLCTEKFPEELSNIASSLGSDADRNLLISAIYKRLSEYLPKLSEKRFFESYRDRLFILGREVEFIQNGVQKRGRAVELTEDFGLTVDLGDEEITLQSGEISVKTSK